MMSRKIRISRRAAEERVRRSLAKDGLALRKASGRFIHELGEYYVVDIGMNSVTSTGWTLE
jgi:hypothetical protein